MTKQAVASMLSLFFLLAPSTFICTSFNLRSVPDRDNQKQSRFYTTGGDEHDTLDTVSAPAPPQSLRETLEGTPINDAGRKLPFFLSPVQSEHNGQKLSLSRREAFEKGAVLFVSASIVAGGILGSPEVKEKVPSPYKSINPPTKSNEPKPIASGQASQSLRTNDDGPKSQSQSNGGGGKLASVNVTKVAAETRINITMECDTGCVSLDQKTFTKIETKKTPKWFPVFLIPPPKVVKEISNLELLVAATAAGSITEMARTSLLYPLQTIKTRIQTDIHNATTTPPNVSDRLRGLSSAVSRHVAEGQLYAGLKPSLLVSVPAMGVYYGVRDVSKRTLGSVALLSDVSIILASALIADVISLCFRTPADALALRLQDQSTNVGSWFGDSLKRLPSVIVTDLPYLLSKIVLGRQFIHGDLSIDRYAEYAIVSAILAAFVTTPFDVVRTRIIVESDGDFSNGFDGGSGEGVIQTMLAVMKEGDGGLANLFAGWLERVLYLGIGRAWLEPLQIIGYVAIRDTLLLKFF